MEKKITQENFEDTYVDSIEMERIDKFVCDEMARQIHRYIKAMKGSKAIMLKFEEQLATLTIPEKEKAIARYIDLNRKVLSGLDFKIVLARAMANYSDTFSYLVELVNNKRKMCSTSTAYATSMSSIMMCTRRTASLVSKTIRAMCLFRHTTTSYAHLMCMWTTCALCL